ncbi:carbon-nitrogen hydrolase family protein [Cupriavidus pinatubonensis]|uniref:carbon-nitrogen hydrolase family protein n=1 Tax=Cupriavidus pinatubonensis TaxID=248026 RepID=UPI0011268A5B|nr:carbon-nitrogen hydrolase family protein [Cupriavidus pinatubonensis]TPQ26629.1 amidohydrolase [Cupriavidus pinatubonensis]
MSRSDFIAACVQVNPQDDLQANIDRACEAIDIAVKKGASLIVLPEYVTFLHASGNAMRANALAEQDDPALQRFRTLAREHAIWILIGSLVVIAEQDRLANRSYLIGNTGEVLARYDKIHMFDATLPGGRAIRESSTYAPGARAMVAHTPLASIGMSVCYDLRFPLLYRAMAQAGAELLVVPAAFTRATGTMHWQALLQARAIENGAYVLAAATCGSHPGGHETYGHAMIVEPTGKILAEAGDEPDVIYARIDTAAVDTARSRIPSLTHDRPFDIMTAGVKIASKSKEAHEPL